MAQNIAWMCAILTSLLSTVIATTVRNHLSIKFGVMKLLAETQICWHIVWIKILAVRTAPCKKLVVMDLIFIITICIANSTIGMRISNIGAVAICFIRVMYPFFEAFEMEGMVALDAWPNGCFDSYFFIANWAINLFSFKSLCECFSDFIFACFLHVNFVFRFFFLSFISGVFSTLLFESPLHRIFSLFSFFFSVFSFILNTSPLWLVLKSCCCFVDSLIHSIIFFAVITAIVVVSNSVIALFILILTSVYLSSSIIWFWLKFLFFKFFLLFHSF